MFWRFYMLLEKLFENLELKVNPFATCRVADGWRLRLPKPDWVTFHYILSGCGDLRLGSGDLLALTPNSLAIIPPGIEHAIQCGHVANETGIDGQGDPNAPLCEFVAGLVDEKSLAVACGRVQASYKGVRGVFDHLKEAIVLDFSDTPWMRNIFEALIKEYTRAGVASAAMMAALMNQCLIQVFRQLARENNGALPWLTALDDPRLAGVIESILEHPEQPYTLEALADIAHMSRSTFIRHFEHSFGRTPMDYLRDIRLRRGAQLLRGSSLSVNGITDKVGFASRSHFSHAFHERYGCSPKEFRRQHH
jgi:AraC family transcriptional activator of mtrCDE